VHIIILHATEMYYISAIIHEKYHFTDTLREISIHTQMNITSPFSHLQLRAIGYKTNIW